MNGIAFLKIMKGVQKVPGDSLSAEQGLDEIDLLDEKGFSCDEYDMKIPALKSSAVFADSPLTDGRTLISGTLGNVTETIRLQLTAGTIIQMAAMLSKLGRFKQDCNDFWDTFGQLEPVYLKHQVIGEPGPRYALLYDIDVDVDTDLIPSEPKRTVTLSIEREPYWRGLAPGDNPKRWTVEHVFVGQSWDSSDADLIAGSNHLFDATIQNRQEYNVAATALLSKNYIDIPAASIPGDAPALVQMHVEMTAVSSPIVTNRLYVGKSSKPDLPVAGVARLPNYILNAADASFGSDTTSAADTGAPIQSGTGVKTRVAVSFATVTTEAMRVRWSPGSVGYFDMSTLRGRFMVFLRARLSAASTVTLRLMASDDIGTVYFPTQSLSATGSGGTGNTTYWEMVYMGVLAFPFNEQQIVIGHDGLGVDVVTTGVSTVLDLLVARTGGAVALYLSDLILIPIDEGNYINQGGQSVNLNNGYIFDNTGYYLHGKPGEYIAIEDSNTADVKSSGLYLTPKERNRLVFLMDYQVAGATPVSPIDNTFRVRGNIIPRWQGLRDA